MASARQRAAARRNIAKAARAARRKRTISRLPKKTRTALGKQAAKVAKRKRKKKSGADLRFRQNRALTPISTPLRLRSG
jgi:hypothetical protein